MIVTLFKKPKIAIAIMFLLTLAIGHRTLFLTQDNSPEALFAADAAARQTYESMLKAFGSDEMVLFQLRGASSKKAKDLYVLAELTREMKKVPGVDAVFSIAVIYDTDYDEPLEMPTPDVLELVKKEVNGIALYRELHIVRDDPTVLSIAAMITMKGPDSRTKMNSALNRIAAKYKSKGYTPLVAGLTPTNAAIEREGRQVQTIFMPLVALFIAIIGWLLFRSTLAIVAMFLPVGCAIAVGMGGLELSGENLNLMNTVLPQLIMVIGFAGAVHLVSRYAAWVAKGLTPEAAVERLVKEKLVPTIFAFGTTSLGFASLLFSDVNLVRVLGGAASGTLVVTMVFVMIGTPSFLLLLKPKIKSALRNQKLLEATAAYSLRRRPVIFGVIVIAMVFIGIGMTRLNTSITVLEMLGDSIPEKQAFVKLEKEGMGLGNIDVWLRVPAKNYKELLVVARKLDKLEARLKKIDMVTSVISVVDHLQIFNMRTNKRPTLPSGLAVLELADEDELKPLNTQLKFFWNKEKGFKIVVLSRSGSEETILKLSEKIRAEFQTVFPKAKIELSGHYLMLLGTPGSLLKTLSWSLAVTVGVIALLFFFAFRSVWLAASGMLTNLVPVAGVIAATGWFSIPMDVATAVVGSIAFGLAVDNSFHYLYHFQQKGNVVEAAAICGKGIVATAIIISVGFAVLGISGFNPVRRFGILSALAVLFALGANAFFLPALIANVSPKRKPTT